jgi:hypothetical protein
MPGKLSGSPGGSNRETVDTGGAAKIVPWIKRIARPTPDPTAWTVVKIAMVRLIAGKPVPLLLSHPGCLRNFNRNPEKRLFDFERCVLHYGGSLPMVAIRI